MAPEASNISQSAAYGVWHVTTQGDCEGRSTRDLRLHEGYLDEVAFALSNVAEYSLNFARANVNQASRLMASRQAVHVCLDGTAYMSEGDQRRRVRETLAGRPVVIESSPYYGAVLLRDIVRASAEERKRYLRKEAALAKLSPEDREVLGLE